MSNPMKLVENYNDLYKKWRDVCCSNSRCISLIENVLERLSKNDADVAPGLLPFVKTTTYGYTTRRLYKTRLIQLIYAHIPNEELYNFDYSLDYILNAFDTQTPIETPDMIMNHLIYRNNVSTKYLRVLMIFYKRVMNENFKIKLTKHIQLPRDKEIEQRKSEENEIFIDRAATEIYMYARNIVLKIQHNKCNNKYIRGTLILLLVIATGMRIKEAMQLTFEMISELLIKSQIDVNIPIKKQRAKINIVTILPQKRQFLEMACEILQKCNNILANIKRNSSTIFSDVKCVLNVAIADEQVRKLLTSNSFRHYNVQDMYMKGIQLQRISNLMNHQNTSSTMHYLNRYRISNKNVDNDGNLIQMRDLNRITQT
jgi:site-specific recombinase XerD